MTLTRLFAAGLLLAGTSVAALAAPKVTASIVPVHSLVASVMDGVGTPELLLQGQGSEHQASYSPEQLRSLGDSDLVFIIGSGLELKLDELSGTEAVKGKSFIALSALEGLTRHDIREGGAWEAHEDHDEHAEDEGGKKDEHGHEGEAAEKKDEHGHEENAGEAGKASFDPHIWLDPENAKIMLAAISSALSKADPANAERYAANEKAAAARLDETSAAIAQSLAPVKDKPYVVFHDAYQYFEQRFGLSPAGAISDISATAPSAQRLQEVRAKLKDARAQCVFREPQFSDKAVKIIVEGTDAKEGVLDPIGADLAPGKGAYAELLLNLSKGLGDCLKAS
jgi:zinc transport system substrate-binding protein